MTKLSAITCIGLFLLSFGNALNVNQNDVKVTDAINNFGIKLYKELSKQHDNLICSGYSISTVLNMLLAGARGNTERELREALGYNSARLSQTKVEESYHRILKNQREQKNDYTLDVANSIWIQENFNVLPEFKSKITNLFYATEEDVDFSSPLATDSINNWVNTETQGKIPKLFEEQLDDATRMVLVNAIYFKGSWVTKFDKDLTEKRTFRYGNGNQESDIHMMNIVSKFPYHESEDLDAQVLELPYDGEDVSMVLVLPKSVDGLRALHNQLNLEKLNSVVDQLEEEKVTVTIPKFESESTMKLNDVLKSLGIKDAFSPKADLSGINGYDDLFVSNALQKAIIEVSEEGTVAAAVSGLEIQTKMMPINPPRHFYFYADHPFLYFIRHKPTGLFLFLGSKTKP